MSQQTMGVEIWSDIVCPWCYIGKRRFETALRQFEHANEVKILWRSFELDPSAPKRREGTSTEHLVRKYGVSSAEAQAMQQRVTAVAAKEGLTYRLDETQGGNTFDAHRLLHLAADHGKQDALKELFLHDYFSEGLAIGDPGALTEAAVRAGLDRAEVERVLSGTEYADAVRADEKEARMFGLSGVPAFIFDRRIGVVGAESPDVLLDALQQAWAAANGETGSAPRSAAR